MLETLFYWFLALCEVAIVAVLVLYATRHIHTMIRKRQFDAYSPTSDEDDGN